MKSINKMAEKLVEKLNKVNKQYLHSCFEETNHFKKLLAYSNGMEIEGMKEEIFTYMDTLNLFQKNVIIGNLLNKLIEHHLNYNLKYC